MDKIIIVESPSKSKTIESYMGSEYKVLSSKGHVRDLAISGIGGLGIDVNNNFKPNYVNIPEKESLIKELVKECKDKEVFLATDPDREGEAISWHLSKILGLDPDENNRVVFNEITKPAVLEAFKHPRKIDKNLVSSQETRRMLDRIIGFKLSSLLQRKIKSKSAGRVQSVALKLIVDLEKEIRAFIPEEYWEIEAFFQAFSAKLFRYKNDKIEIKNEEEAKNILASLSDSFIVSDIENKPTYREPKPAYITSTLQQDGSTKLGFQSSKTMRIAQGLYEGKEIKDGTVGLITYMRTDSDRLSDIFVHDALSYIKTNYGDDYVGHTHHKKVAQSQDAHEAIRPTSLNRTPESVKEYLTKEEYKLYEMIYNRAVASLMAPAKFSSTKIELENNGYYFKATGSTLLFDGYLKVFGDNETKDSLLPKLEHKKILNALKVVPSQHFTKAPSRYTEAKLIKDMEELGIGRPSTYAQTMDTIRKREYVKIEDKHFIPTDQGILTIDKLDEFFGHIISVKYTANMETVLDEIAQGKRNWNELIRQFYFAFIPMVENAEKNMKSIEPQKTGEVCPICNSPMVLRKGKYGSFEACSNYPSCRYIKKEEKETIQVVKLDIVCPKCHVGHFVERVASKGKNKGKKFYACDNFPRCKNIVNGYPINQICPECGNILVETPDGILCGNEKCHYKK